MRSGILVLDKPLGIRSTTCVERVRKAVGRDTKVGHGGTLDSSASGVLVLLLGGATRLSNLITQMPKVYTADIRFGMETDTCDFTGVMQGAPASVAHIAADMVDALIPSFLGWRMQVPPKISAVHVDGRRAHAIAREGGELEIAPRPVYIERIERVGEIGEIAEGVVRLRVHCGKGTYIRSIARDLGRMLGCGAHIHALTRESVGPFIKSTAPALPPLPSSTTPLFIDRPLLEEKILPLDTIGEFLPHYELPETESAKLANGLRADFSSANRKSFGSAAHGGFIFFSSSALCSVAHLEMSESGLSVVPDINIFMPTSTEMKKS